MLLSGCTTATDTSSDGPQAGGGTPTQARAATQTEDCVNAIQQQVDEALARFKTRGAEDLAALQPVQRLDPHDCPSWDGATTALALEADAEELLRQVEAQEGNPDEGNLDPVDYTALTGPALVAAALRRYDVTGYGTAGTVQLTKAEDEESITIQATLASAE